MKIEGAEDRTWVKSLPTHAVLEILDVMHDCLGGGLRQALQDERWLRLSKPLQEWPMTRQKFSIEAAANYTNKQEAVLTFVNFCQSHTDNWRDRRPDDPVHKPHRFIPSEPTDPEVKEYPFSEFACACGWRARFGKRERIGPAWWPVIKYDFAITLSKKRLNKKFEQFYVVCKHAKGDRHDPRHAPSSVDVEGVVMACICGSHPHSEDLNYLPVDD